MKDESLSINFEYAVRQFLGNKGYHIADLAFDDTTFRQWLRKCIPIIRKRIDQLDTTIRHKEMLMDNIEQLNASLKFKGEINYKKIIVALFWIISRLLGFDYVSGKVYHELFYYQSYWQYIKGKANQNSKKTLVDIDLDEKKNIVSVRRRLIKQLKNEGLSDPQIASILNMSEKQVIKYKHNI